MKNLVLFFAILVLNTANGQKSDKEDRKLYSSVIIKTKIEASILALKQLVNDKSSNKYVAIVEFSRNPNNKLSNTIIIGIEDDNISLKNQSEVKVCNEIDIKKFSEEVAKSFTFSKAKSTSFIIKHFELDCYSIKSFD
jgi:hypothetical protein